MFNAYVTGDDAGRLTAPVPAAGTNGFVIWSHRVAAALATIGYRIGPGDGTREVVDGRLVYRFNAVPRKS